MAKKATAARQARGSKQTKKAATAPAQEPQELQGANGAEAKPEGAAALPGGAEAKASDGATQPKSDAADPVGTEGAPTASAEQSREQAAAASTDRKDGADVEKQPEDTARPPVVGSPEGRSIVVRGPKNGRWRSGMHFGPDGTEIEPEAFLARFGGSRLARPRASTPF
jgi:hypothetical protein